MKNKVDVRKLIKKKYSDNTLELPDLLEEIDLVLNEMKYNYTSKLNTANLEENPLDPGNARAISYRMHGPGRTGERPPERGYNNTEPPQVRADKLAEADEDKPSPTSSDKGVVRVRIPDIFTMITNQNMGIINDDERKKINEIVVGIKGSNWKDRVKGFSEYIVGVQKDIKPGTGKDDFREIISKLIFMTLLRKISLMTAQPGKLFEYILAPLIGSTARVVGSSDQEIVDVINDKGYAYQLKLFTGGKTDKLLNGSRTKFANYISGDEETLKRMNIDQNLWKSGMKAAGDALTYILSSANQKQNIVDFVEMRVYLDDMNLTKTQSFINQGYIAITEPSAKSDGVVFIDNKGNNFGVVFMFEHPQQQLNLVFNKKPATPQISKAKISDNDPIELYGTTYNRKVLVSQKRDIDANLGDYSMQTNSFKKPQSKKNIITKLAELNVDTEQKSDQEIADIAVKTSLDIQNVLKPSVTQTTQQTAVQSAAQTASFSALNPITKEFGITLVSQWQQLSPIKMDLGNYQQVNEWQVQTANIIQKTMVDVLNSFDSLGKNMTNYFGTATSRNTAAYGQECVNDARKITNGIISIGASEGDSIKE
jgi:hypothetical protein